MSLIKKYKYLLVFFALILTNSVFGTENLQTVVKDLEAVMDVQKYNRAIHIMVMLLAGFGFLMVFIKKYGRSAVTATYLLVSVAIPMYFLKDSNHILGGSGSEVDGLILAEFAAASLLIAAGAVLGRLKMGQYIVLAILFIPAYIFNEWILLDNGLGLIAKGVMVDTGGSIVIHAFGAIFGLGLIMTMTTKKEFETEIEADDTSDRFSMLGSILLWIFWPSFCAALVAPADIPATAVNVILALSGSTIATYFASVGFRKKINIADIANAALAGGVAIGSVCDKTTPTVAFIIGILAGVLSTFGFAVLQSKLQNMIKKTDSCGVLYLHGLPGILGGLSALFVAEGVDFGGQLTGILITIVVALVTGFIVGKLVALFGRRIEPYTDEEEFEME